MYVVDSNDDVAVQPNMSTPFLIVAVVIIVLLINLMSIFQIHSVIGLGHTIQRNFQDPLKINANSSSSSSSSSPQCLDFNGGGLDVLIEKGRYCIFIDSRKSWRFIFQSIHRSMLDQQDADPARGVSKISLIDWRCQSLFLLTLIKTT